MNPGSQEDPELRCHSRELQNRGFDDATRMRCWESHGGRGEFALMGKQDGIYMYKFSRRVGCMFCWGLGKAWSVLVWNFLFFILF